MTAITEISTAVPVTAASTLPDTEATQAATAGKAATAGNTVAPPTDIVSLSSSAAAATQGSAPSRSMSPTQVDDALSWVSGANGFAFLAAHFDYAGTVAQFGKAIADRDLGMVQAAADESASRAQPIAENLGIPVQVSANQTTGSGGTASGTLTVSAFSFTSGGSTYSVTPGANGMLVGTKDGQAWKTWQLIDTNLPGNPALAASPDSSASAALQVLTSLTKQTGTLAGQRSQPLDLSA